MKGFNWSKKSLDKLKTLDERLEVLMNYSLENTPIDFGINETYRPKSKQLEYFKKGRKSVKGEWIITDKEKVITNVDGYKIVGKHNVNPSKAVDIFAFINGKVSYDTVHLSILAGVIMGNAKKLGIKVRWGGTFGSKEFKGWDMPHYELID